MMFVLALYAGVRGHAAGFASEVNVIIDEFLGDDESLARLGCLSDVAAHGVEDGLLLH